MPIEIRELNIKAFVNETPQQDPKGAAGGGNGSLSAPDRDKIIADCVQQVLRILKDKEER